MPDSLRSSPRTSTVRPALDVPCTRHPGPRRSTTSTGWTPSAHASRSWTARQSWSIPRERPLLGQVVAPMHRLLDPIRADWRDKEARSVRTNLSGHSILQTLGDALLQAWKSFDRRTVAADGQPTGSGTEGITTASPSIAGRVRVIGKESRGLGVGR